MKVLWINYRYFVSGGPETYMFAATDLLERAGHDVIPFSLRYSRNRETPWAGFFADPIAGDDEVNFSDQSRSVRTVTRGLQRSFYAPDVRDAVSRIIGVAKPDVAMVQHYLRHLSPSVLVALKRAGVPIVVRLSDFGMVCPKSVMLRDGRICRSCVTLGLLSSVRYRCVRDSLPVSVVACASLIFVRWRKFFDLIDCFIAPSAIMREEMIAGGYDGSRIVVVPTFVDATGFDVARARDRRIVYVGRLSPEKGLHVLLDGFERMRREPRLRDVELHIVGDGDPAYRSGLVSLGRSMGRLVKFTGPLGAQAVRDTLATSLLSAVPSMCYENLPNSMLESLAAGTPVVASDLGSMGDVLRGTNAGLLFRPGDANDLAAGLTSLLLDPDRVRRMSKSARTLAESRYSPDKHLSSLLDVFERVIAGATMNED